MGAMLEQENKATMKSAFNALAKGDGRVLLDHLDENVTWTIMGRSSWSGTSTGKANVMKQFFGPLFGRFNGDYTNTATRLIAEGDTVVVECRGRATTVSGGTFDNHYCWICRLDGGRLVEVVEYIDTLGVETDLGAKQPHRAPRIG